jgi:hypothetical protein
MPLAGKWRVGRPRRIDALLQGVEENRRKIVEQQELLNAAVRKTNRLQKDWIDVFPGGGDLADSHVQSGIVQRYMALGVLMREMLWDYEVSALLDRDHDPPEECAVILLGFACLGNAEELRYTLDQSHRHRLFPAALFAHYGLYEKIRQQWTGYPATPLLSRRDLARVIGVTYPKLQGDMKAGRWNPDGDYPRHTRLRRWRNRDFAVHGWALRQIRDKFPEKLWSKLLTPATEVSHQKLKVSQKPTKRRKS